MRKLLVLAVVAAALTTAACNTVAGVGRDAQAAGSAVESAAHDANACTALCERDHVRNLVACSV